MQKIIKEQGNYPNFEKKSQFIPLITDKEYKDLMRQLYPKTRKKIKL